MLKMRYTNADLSVCMSVKLYGVDPKPGDLSMARVKSR